jgi:hypothetical protein
MLCSFEKYVAKNQLIFLFKKAGYWGISGNTNWAGYQQQDFYPVICQPSNDH